MQHNHVMIMEVHGTSILHVTAKWSKNKMNLENNCPHLSPASDCFGTFGWKIFWSSRDGKICRNTYQRVLPLHDILIYCFEVLSTFKLMRSSKYFSIWKDIGKGWYHHFKLRNCACHGILQTNSDFGTSNINAVRARMRKQKESTSALLNICASMAWQRIVC